VSLHTGIMSAIMSVCNQLKQGAASVILHALNSIQLH